MKNTAAAARFTDVPEPFAPILGIAVVCGTHTQIDLPLAGMLIALAQKGHHIAVIVANNHFEMDEIARVVPPEQLKVARGETPHQVRHLAQRLVNTRTAYSVVVVVGLLESFYDEQVQWKVAVHLLTDTLALLSELARTLSVLVLITPPPNATRPSLRALLIQAADQYTELPAPTLPKQLPEGRLF